LAGSVIVQTLVDPAVCGIDEHQKVADLAQRKDVCLLVPQ
jgi:hypothetical protein